MEEAGQKLKRVRERLELSLRQVVDASLRIAERHQNDEYAVPLGRLSDIEKGSVPSICRLCSLCSIYRLDVSEVLSWYEISFPSIPGDADLIQLPRTHSIGFRPEQGEIQGPVTLDPGFDVTKTVFLSRQIQKWGRVPLMLFNSLDLREFRYAYVGTEDWSMYPILAPGAIVVVDDTKRRIASSGWTSEWDRPIYFLEHQDGYVCGWCSVNESQLMVQFRGASERAPEVYAYPQEIEIIGQITHVAMTLGRTPPLRP